MQSSRKCLILESESDKINVSFFDASKRKLSLLGSEEAVPCSALHTLLHKKKATLRVNVGSRKSLKKSFLCYRMAQLRCDPTIHAIIIGGQ
jgi:hypothetical protein